MYIEPGRPGYYAFLDWKETLPRRLSELKSRLKAKHCTGTLKIGYDMDGVQLFDGDKVLSFNLMADGETYPLSGPKQGVLCTIRRENGRTWVRRGDGSECGCSPSDPQFGVRKVKGAN